jgi:hypothetical protein
MEEKVDTAEPDENPYQSPLGEQRPAGRPKTRWAMVGIYLLAAIISALVAVGFVDFENDPLWIRITVPAVSLLLPIIAIVSIARPRWGRSQPDSEPKLESDGTEMVHPRRRDPT